MISCFYYRHKPTFRALPQARAVRSIFFSGILGSVFYY
jgi:hypothetical protein